MTKRLRIIIAAGILTALTLFAFLCTANAAQTAVQPANGGTGLTTLPSYGQILVGNSSSGYTLTATSSLGISSGSGTVTSVGFTAPTGLSISGAPITTSGTFGLSWVSGYTPVLTASSTNWNSAYDGWNANNANWTTAYNDRITTATYPLSISGTTISTVATSSLSLTTSSFASHNVSQWTNDAGYLTSLAGAASSTLLSDNNTFSGTNIFTNSLTLSSTTGTTTIASGQGFTIGGSQFVVQQGSGNVGIGTSSPQSLLAVQGGTNASLLTLSEASTQLDPYITLQSTAVSANSAPAINWTNSAGGLTTASISSAPGAGYNSSNLIFSVANSSQALTEAARFITNGDFGIGITAPTSNLYVQNDYGSTNANIFTVASSTNAGGTTRINFLNILANGQTTLTAPTTLASGAYTHLTINGAQSVASTGDVYGVITDPTYTDATPGDTLAGLVGLESAAANSGAGIITNLWGVYSAPITAGTSMTTNMYGFQSFPETSGSATTTSEFGYSSQPSILAAATGLITNEYGLYVAGGNSSTAGATLTNYYGAYLNTPIKTGTITNTPYGVYQVDANSKNYFAGNVGEATTTPWGSISITNSGTEPALYIANSTNATPQFIVSSTGNVGIGTTTPFGKLDVGGLINAPAVLNMIDQLALSGSASNSLGLEIRNTSANAGAFSNFVVSDNNGQDFLSGIIPSTANSSTNFGLARSGLAELITNTNGGSGRILALGTITNTDMLLGTDNVERMRITAAGNVGIGTTTPPNLFSVVKEPTGNGTTATTTVEFGDYATTTSQVCFNTKNIQGAGISFYFTGTTMVVDANRNCN